MPKLFKVFSLFLFILLISIQCVCAKSLHREKDYQKYWCDLNGGAMEYVVAGTRVDCLLPDYAVEFDFAKKWEESIGQALYYGIHTNRIPSVVLILEQEKDQRFLNRLLDVAQKYNIQVWTITPEELESKPIPPVFEKFN